MVLVTSMILEFLFYYNTRCCDTSQVHDDYTNMYIICLISSANLRLTSSGQKRLYSYPCSAAK
ncbi:hypothetical protein PVAP13_8NG244301 [Panicum virgatum]|uniref:Uncharacterized protein n=1 Tax=Panicum virgatum TaxID=38727 RepID=A0A8T0P9K6_PANVG|nr:hypothetical protein PVAP13_8NG244301 [Panicum virgatum]